ncbi:MAG: tRNA 4-thiouridine(8) synthase ThiI [Atribacterota bacterium]
MRVRAIGLISGGLDSALAVSLLKKQDIEVIALRFLSPFWGRGNQIKQLVQELGVEYREIEVDESYLAIIKNPRYGYGKNMNSCIDCKIWMLRRTRELMEEWGASFVFTGEVIGQRPKSQMKNTLRLIEKQSGLKGLLLRPLSAKLLPETIPEKEGWIKREALLDISGRGREKQLKLAEEWKIRSFSPPAGGCLLTEPNFSRRLRDLLQHGGNLTFQEIELLKLGRHFRFNPTFKLIVGRDAGENEKIWSVATPEDVLFFPVEGKGPIALGRGRENRDTLEDAASLLAYYVRYEDHHVPIGIEHHRLKEVWRVPKMEEQAVRQKMI